MKKNKAVVGIQRRYGGREGSSYAEVTKGNIQETRKDQEGTSDQRPKMIFKTEAEEISRF